jgi:hypothetical protein
MLSVHHGTRNQIMLELLGLAHREFPIIPNKSQRSIHAWWVATLQSHLASGGKEKPTYQVDYSLCTYKYVDDRRKGEIHARARLPRLAGRGMEWHGVAIGMGARCVRE